MRLPEVKTPKFLTDLVRDLRDRRLLPLVAVLVVAIVAVPIALSKPTTQPQSPAGKSSLLGAALAAKASHLTAVPNTPGLRDYHRRLKGRHATNPFTPPPSAAPATQSESASTQSSVAESSSSASVPSSSGSAAATTGNGSTTSGEAPSLLYFTHAIDVRVVNLPSASSNAAATKSEPIVRHNLPGLSKLPSNKTPAAIFLGTSSNGTKAVLLISSNVLSLSGKNHCLLGASGGLCQLLALEPGSPETFVYGPNGRTFRILLLKVHLVVTHHRPH